MSAEPTADEAVQRARALVDTIKPILAGHGGTVQGAALLELLALFLAGHPPQIREAVLGHHLEAVRRLLPAIDDELYGPSGHPGSSQ